MKVRVRYDPRFSCKYWIDAFDGTKWESVACAITYWGARVAAWRLARKADDLVLWESD